MKMLAIALFHLTCHEAAEDDDPPTMVVEMDPNHSTVAKYTCPLCNHKVLLDVAIRKEQVE